MVPGPQMRERTAHHAGVAPVEFHVDGPERALDEADVRQLPWEGVVALDQVLRHSLPAYGGDTWSQALPGLCSSPGQVELVGELAAELAGRLAADPRCHL